MSGCYHSPNQQTCEVCGMGYPHNPRSTHPAPPDEVLRTALANPHLEGWMTDCPYKNDAMMAHAWKLGRGSQLAVIDALRQRAEATKRKLASAVEALRLARSLIELIEDNRVFNTEVTLTAIDATLVAVGSVSEEGET